MTMVGSLPAAMRPLVDVRELRIGIERGHGEPLVVVTSRFAKAENDTRVLAVTVKLVGEVVA